MDKCAIFLDGAYVDKLLFNEFGRARLDYMSLPGALAEGCDILRTYWYHCPPYQSNPPTAEERARVAASDTFHAALKKLPRFEVRLGKLAKRGVDAQGHPIFIQKRVDLMIGVDMVELAATDKIQRAILLAGDSDLVPAIEATKRHGVLTVLWHGPKRVGANNTVHDELWSTCDERREMTQTLVDQLRRR